MRWPRATAPAWPVHAVTAALIAGAGAAYALAGPGGRPAIYTLVSVLPIITFLAALASGHLPDRRPWLIAVVGLVLLFAGQLGWPGWMNEHHLGRAQGSMLDLMQSTAHTFFLVGTAMAIRRRARSDPAGIIDAALFGLCAGGPLWEWVIQPNLPAAATPLGETLLLADLLVLGAVIGCLLRLGAMARPGRGTLGYLLVTALLTLVSTVTGTLSTDVGSGWSTGLMLMAYLTIAAAPLAPDAPAMTVPVPRTGHVAGRQRLGWLAAALSANPLIAAVQVVRGSESASLLLPVGTLLVVPLVLLRIRHLSAQRDRAERTLAYHATHDELTGLYNRRHIAAEIDRALAEVQRGTLDEVTILLCDLDGFKPVNDRYGHPAGDAVLKAVAERLTATVRRDDLVGRLGGDEFLIVCRGTLGPDAGDLPARITEAVRAPFPLPEGVVSVGVTTGLAQAGPGRAADRDLLIGLADAAMYAGKAARGGDARRVDAAP
ncbi:GGDEF domain-containing protein [Actinoplanes sp. NPDC049599]|uniref:GGDEF domain-containing protein n=1 Tax=Actinoplanes sp. NPDC049599 TaxID=3363903 RepID=UPI0037B6C772